MWPAAAMKVFAIPPPTMIWSAIFEREFNTSNLVETLEPPTIATIGRAGSLMLYLMHLIAAASNGPAQATGANSATP